MKEPCNTCPFRRHTENTGVIDWAYDVYRMIRMSKFSHTCHKTDPNADGYVRGEAQQCAGIGLVNANDACGRHVFKDMFASWREFFEHHLDRIKKHSTTKDQNSSIVGKL